MKSSNFNAVNRYILKFSTLSLAIAASTVSAEQKAGELESLTVYGQLNALILESGTATKSNMSLLETPAAVVVVDEELLLEQSTSTLQDALRNISGLTQDGNNYGVGDNLSLRGLGVNYTYDGLYGGSDLGNSYNPTRSTTNISSIEVLKGPATGLYGMGSAGGVINMIEKKPQDEASHTIKVGAGAWNSYSIMADSTSAINDTTAYRLVAAYETSDGFRDQSFERSEIYGSLRFNLTDNQSLIVSTAYIDDAVQIDSVGHPVRLIDLGVVGVEAGSVTAADLPNDAIATTADGAVILTDDQIQTLADSLATTDGIRPFDIGDTSLVSPISTPNEGEEFRLKIRHDWNVSDDWSITQQLQHRTYESEYIRQTGGFNYVYFERNGVIHLDPRAPLVIDDVLYPYAARRQEYRRIVADEAATQYFADIKGEWESGSIRGEHLITAYYENLDISYQQHSIWDADDGRSDPVPYILDIRDPNWSDLRFDDFNPVLRSQYDKTVTSTGIGFQEVLYIGNAITGRIGVAHSSIDQDYKNLIADDNQVFDHGGNGTTFNIGATYKFSDTASVFVNAAQGQTAYGVLSSLNGETDRPNSESESFDLGFRFTALEENLLASVVYFDTARTNQRYSNPDYDEVDNPSVPQYYFDQKDQTTGVEFDMNVVVNDNWKTNLTYTYQDPVTVPGANASSQEDTPTKGVPRRFMSLWTTYSQRFAGLNNPVKFSVGVERVSERSIASSSFGIDYAIIEAYTTFDTAISYQNDNWKIQLNVDNLTDESYYSKALFLGGLPGEERNASVSVSYTF